MKLRKGRGLIFLVCFCCVFKVKAGNEDFWNVHTPNKFLSVRLSCTPNTLTVTAITDQVFNGALYAHGYPLECRAFGNNSREIQLTIDVTACGIKVEENQNGNVHYQLSLHLQYDRTVQQAIDEIFPISCTLNDNHQKLQSHDLRNVVPTSQRRGRVSGGFQPEVDVNEQLLMNWPSSRSGRRNYWLDILDEKNSEEIDQILVVGQEAKVVIKVRDKVGIEAKIVNCVGHDGTEETFQPLVDKNGCSVDETIMPAFTKFERKGKAVWFQSSFPAFKFPDRDFLHLKCLVLICKNKCTQVNCNNRENGTEKVTFFPDEIVDVIEVFNSVQVQAPGIEMDAFHLKPSEIGRQVSKSVNYTADDYICTSPTRIIVTFGSLIGIFVIAILISAISFAWIKLNQRLFLSHSESVLYLPYSPAESYS